MVISLYRPSDCPHKSKPLNTATTLAFRRIFTYCLHCCNWLIFRQNKFALFCFLRFTFVTFIHLWNILILVRFEAAIIWYLCNVVFTPLAQFCYTSYIWYNKSGEYMWEREWPAKRVKPVAEIKGRTTTQLVKQRKRSKINEVKTKL